MSAEITLRPATPADLDSVARILFDAFSAIADQHNFPRDFPSADIARQLCGLFLGAPKVYGIVAISEGRIIGSNFLDERDPIRGVGPITVDPAFQGKGVGRKLMQNVIERGQGLHGGQPGAGIRLVQDAFNTVSMSLYSSLGFEVREPLVMIVGKPATSFTPTAETRPLRESDLPAAAALCKKIHGWERTDELAGALKMFGPMGLFRKDRLVAYISAPTFWPLNHGVAESDSDLTELLNAAGAARPEPLALLLPTRRTHLLRWALQAKLRILKPMTLMSIGPYHEPAGAFYPSVGY